MTPSNAKRLQDLDIKPKKFTKEVIVEADTPESLRELLLDIEKMCEDHEAKFSEKTVGLDY